MPPLTVLLVEDDGNYASLVQHWLSAPDSGFILNWTDSLAAARARLEQGGIDLVLLDLGLPDSDGIATFLELRQSASGLPIIISSSADSESLALETVQRGAQDYLVKNQCDGPRLLKALQYAHLRHHCHSPASAGPQGQARVVGLVGVKGGVGVTTIACTLAAELRNQTNQRVLLVDLDPHAGLVSFVLGLEPLYSAPDVVDQAERLDRAIWDAMVTRYLEGLDVLGSSPSSLRPPAEAALRTLLSFARPLYDWVVLDLGRLNAASMTLLSDASDALAVTTPAVSALYLAKRLVEECQPPALPQNRLHLVVNQSESAESLGPREIDRLFGAYVYAELPDDARALQTASARMKLPAESSALRRAIAGMAARLAGLEPAKPKPGVAQWFSFLARPRPAA